MATHPPATFDEVASRYERHAVAQRDAGERHRHQRDRHGLGVVHDLRARTFQAG